MQKLTLIVALLAAAYNAPVRAQDECAAVYKATESDLDQALQPIGFHMTLEELSSIQSLSNQVFIAIEWIRLTPSSRTILCSDARLNSLHAVSQQLLAAGLLQTEAERAEAAQRSMVEGLDKAVQQVSDLMARRKMQSPSQASSAGVATGRRQEAGVGVSTRNLPASPGR